MALVLGGVRLDLAAPPRISQRWAPVLSIRRPGCEPLAIAAALGLCAPVLQRHVPYQHDVLAFGAAIIDFLMAPERRQSVKRPDGTTEELFPATFAEVQKAGAEAFSMCMNNLVDVEGVADFTKPPAGTPKASGRNSRGGSTPGN